VCIEQLGESIPVKDAGTPLEKKKKNQEKGGGFEQKENNRTTTRMERGGWWASVERKYKGNFQNPIFMMIGACAREKKTARKTKSQ